MDCERRILFVYNADSPLLAQLKDYVHKIVSPDTYPCSLCQITYGNLGMKRAWRRYVRNLPYPAVFLHRDELAGGNPQLLEYQLPAVFVEDGANITLLVSAEDLDRTPNLSALQELVLARLSERAHAAVS
ncbi:MAG: hypothetical protein F4X83_02165 [Chloroflexi bacterium]|nr:hypothetical protein [Chloroflexota bacterium]